MPAWFEHWRTRHRHPVSFWLHMIGIPMAVAAIVLAVVQLWLGRWDLWWRPAALLVGGYLPQWIGHQIEGNDVGEIILIKKLLGKRYVAVSPKYGRKDPPTSPRAATSEPARAEPDRGDRRRLRTGNESQSRADH